ncbi:MAG: protein kinase [Verrucomicrobiales bacterium]|nr:protein kinase [Verrucomicrobiales bacterium]
MLVGSDDRPRVTDFGLAKRLTNSKLETPNSELTLSGHVLGSPNYLPPEQSGGARSKVGPTSDVYSLGAILYHLLTARPPFRAETISETLQQVQTSEPLSPRLLNPSVPRDLETICLKCLEKEPSRRYQTAQDLVEELDRFLRDEPIHARPVIRAERAWRWCRRKPALAGVGGFAFLLLLIVLLGGPIALFQINQKKLEAERNLYSANMKFASEALRDGSIDHAQALLGPQPANENDSLRNFEWRHLWHAMQQRKAKLTLRGLPNNGWRGTRLERIGDRLYNVEPTRGQIRAWDVKTWTNLLLPIPEQSSSVEWWWTLAEETAFAVDNPNRTLTVYQLPDFKRVLVIPLAGNARRAAISPDQHTLALCFKEAGAQRVGIWDTVQGTERGVVGPYEGEVFHLLFSPDSRVVAVACGDGVIELRDAVSLKPLPSPPKNRVGPWDVLFALGGQRLLFDRRDESETLHVWDRDALSSATLRKEGVASSLDWFFGVSSDGKIVLTAGYSGEVRLHEAKTLRECGKFRGHRANITAFEFSPESSLLATGSIDHSVKLWDVATGGELTTLGGHGNLISDLVFSEDGKALVTIDADGQIKVWDVPTMISANVLIRNSKASWRFHLSPDERTIAAVDVGGTVHVWDRFRRTEIHSIQVGQFADGDSDVALAPNGNSVGWLVRDSLGLLDLETRKHKRIEIQGNRTAGLAGLTFSPDGREIAFSSHTNVVLCEVATGNLRPFASFAEETDSLSYSPNGELLAFGHEHGTVTLWDRRSERKLDECRDAHVFLVSCVAFSTDGQWLASSGSQTINLWRVTNKRLEQRKKLTAHVGYMTAVAFSPDGKRLVSASSDQTLKLWNTSDGMEVGTLYGHSSCVSDVFFSKSGHAIFSNGQDGTIRIWEAPPLAQLRR